MDTLDLNAPVERPKVRLGEKEFELLAQDDMSLKDAALIKSVHKKFKTLSESEELAEEVAEKFLADLDRAIKTLFVEISDEDFAKLETWQKSRILDFWGKQMKAQREDAEGESAEENPTE